jgi:hypothetical protein
LASVRREARYLMERQRTAIRLIEAALMTHGSSRHPLIDSLLDVRNALRAG